MGNVINQSSCVIFGIVFALTICWKLALVLIFVFPLLIFIQIYLVSIISKKTENLKKLNEKNSGYLEEILYNIKTVASFCNFDYEKTKYQNELEDCVRFTKKFGIKSSFSIAFLNLCMSIMFGITFIVGGYLLYKKETNGNKLLDSGNIYSVLSLVTSAGFQLTEMATNIKVLTDCLTNLKNFYDLRNYMKKKEKEKNNNKIIIQSDDNENNSKNNTHLIQGSISFKNVTFSYPNNSNKLIFKNLNLEIPANKTTAIIGKSGCGKSTLLNLIEKIYKPNSGEILLDNINIDDIDINSLRDKIGYVAQEPILFNDTIKNNIIFGRNLENEDELVDLAIKNAYAYNFIHKFPDKLNHIVGIKGGKISGGQKQRLAIARALYKQPEILILDEATSALDNKSEKK
jgi:ATP-binding cassette subfamily B (MDR/TAP) protein 1